MSIPLLPATLALLAGMVASELCRVTVWPALALLLLVALVVLALALERRFAATFGVLALFFVAGAVAAPPPPEGLEAAWTDLDGEHPGIFEGRVVDLFAAVQGRSQIELELAARCEAGGCRAAAGRVLLTVVGPAPGMGEYLRFRCRLNRLEPAWNPGASDPGSSLRRRGILRRGVVPEGGWVTYHRARAGLPAARWERLEGRLLALRESIREELRTFYVREGRPSEVGLMLGLTLGDRSRILEELKAEFARAGLAHLLAISGSHFTLVAVGAEWIVRCLMLLIPPLFRRVPVLAISPLVAAVPTVLYGWLVGVSPSIGRSVLMAVVVLGLRAACRRVGGGAVLTLAGLVLLSLDPAALGDVGCQLSFASVAALIALAPPLQRSVVRLIERVPGREHPVGRWVHRGLEQLSLLMATSAAATAGTAPLCALYFGSISWIGVLANVLAVPLLGALSLPLLLGAGMLHLGGLPGGTALLAVGGFVVGLGREVGQFFGDAARFPAWNLYVGALDAVWMGGMLLCLLLPARWCCLGAGLLGLLWQGGRLAEMVSRPPEMPLRVTQLNVGQGDALVLTLPDGRVVVVDGGGMPPGQQAGFDPGRHVILPFLRSRGIERIDLMILSHPHPDHLGGLISLAEALPVGGLWMGERPTRDGYFRDFVEGLEARGVPTAVIEAGMPLPAAGGVTFRCLHPVPGWQESLAKRKARSVNNGSLVLELSYGEVDLLLTGDIEREVEAQLIEAGALRPVEIVKAPHHGSDTSSTDGLVEALRPSVVLMGVGRDNRFGFPRRSVVRRWGAVDARIFRTDQDGALELEIERHGFRVRRHSRAQEGWRWFPAHEHGGSPAEAVSSERVGRR